MAQKDTVGYSTILPFTAGDYSLYEGIRIYVPTTPLIMDFFCICDEIRKTSSFYCNTGMHYFCLCHGHNGVYSLHCRLPSNKQILNLDCSRPRERYFIIYDKKTKEHPECNIPSLISLSKSATFQYKLEDFTKNNEEFPKNLFDMKIRTKNCIVTDCYMDLGMDCIERDCTDYCPDKTNICNRRQERISPNYTNEFWKKQTEKLKTELRIWSKSRE